MSNNSSNQALNDMDKDKGTKIHPLLAGTNPHPTTKKKVKECAQEGNMPG